jgi:hypothetical protein
VSRGPRGRVSAARLPLAAMAIAAGLAAGWAASGRPAVVAWMAILVAAANGYSKAHSP